MVSISVHRDLLKWSLDYMGRLQDPSKITYMERVSGSRHKPSRGVVWCAPVRLLFQAHAAVVVVVVANKAGQVVQHRDAGMRWPRCPSARAAGWGARCQSILRWSGPWFCHVKQPDARDL